MNKSSKIRFVLHPTFFIVMFFYFLVGDIFVFIQYIIVLLLHELMHATIARRLGYKMNKIVLYPFGVSLSGEDDEFSPRDEIKISLAGPVLNLLLCVICFALWWIEPISYYYTSVFCTVNVVCGLFNLLPVFPLDGGRICLAILSIFFDRKQSVKIIKGVTAVFCTLLLLLCFASVFVKFNISFGIMSIVLFVSVLFEDRQTAYLRICNMKFREKKLRRGIIEKVLVVDENASLSVALRHISSSFMLKFKVVDEHFAEKCVLNESEFINAITRFGSCAKFKEIIDKY